MNTILFVKKALKVQALVAVLLSCFLIEAASAYETSLRKPSGFEWDEPIRRIRFPYEDLNPDLYPQPAPAPAPPSDSPAAYAQWLTQINAVNAWKYSTGQGVTVALLDTGIDLRLPGIAGMNLRYNNAEITGRGNFDDDNNGCVDDRYGCNFINLTGDVHDGNGHGTHVAGIVGGRGQYDVYGVSQDANLLALKVLNNQMTGQVSHASNAIYYAVNNGARVINLSLSAEADDPNNSLEAAIQYAYDHGVIVITGSGNDGTAIGSRIPASLDNVITVGGIRIGEENRYSASNYGPDLDFVTPATRIPSYHAIGTPYGCTSYDSATGECTEPGVNDPVVLEWGTSLAAPMVSGTVALLLARDPMLTFSDIYRRLQYSATDLGAVGRDDYYGWGLIDAARAMAYDYYESGRAKSYWFTDEGENLFLGDGLLQPLLTDFLLVSDLLERFANAPLLSIDDFLGRNILRQMSFFDELYLNRAANDRSNMKGYGRLSELIYADGSYDRFYYEDYDITASHLRRIDSYSSDGYIVKSILWYGGIGIRLEYHYMQGVILATHAYSISENDAYIGWLSCIGEMPAQELERRLDVVETVRQFEAARSLTERLVLRDGVLVALQSAASYDWNVIGVEINAASGQHTVTARSNGKTVSYKVQEGLSLMTVASVTWEFDGQSRSYEIRRQGNTDEILWSVWNGTGFTYYGTRVEYAGGNPVQVYGCSPWPGCLDLNATPENPPAGDIVLTQWSVVLDQTTHAPASMHTQGIYGTGFGGSNYYTTDTYYASNGNRTLTRHHSVSGLRETWVTTQIDSATDTAVRRDETVAQQRLSSGGVLYLGKRETTVTLYNYRGVWDQFHYTREIYDENSTLIYQDGFIRFSDGRFWQIEYTIEGAVVTQSRLLNGAKIIFEGVENRVTPNPAVLAQGEGYMNSEELFAAFMISTVPPPPIVQRAGAPAPAPAAPDALLAVLDERNAVLDEQARQAAQVSRQDPDKPDSNPYQQA